MTKAAPSLIAVDDDAGARERIGAELSRRYGADYRITCAGSAETAVDELRRIRQAGEDVALVLADPWLGETTTGSELLSRVRGLHPHAKRALLIDWGAWAHRPTTEAILEAMALGRIDYYVLKPSRPGDEYFHRTITEFLHEWTREHTGAHELVVFTDPKTPRGHEICDLLRRSGIPFGLERSDSAAARELLEGNGEQPSGPILRLHDGRVLVDPTNEEIAAAYGVDTQPPSDADNDVIIVGAGPAGLSAAVYASSEGLRTLVLQRQAVGGQAGSSSLIRNYLGFSRGIGGGELSQRAYQQAWIFGARFAITRDAIALDEGDHRHRVHCDAGFTADTGAVVLATGVSYRRLGIRALDGLTGAGVFYGASTAGAQGLANEQVYVVGGGNSAGQAALHLARSADRVTLLVRGQSLAIDMSQYLRETISAAPNIEVQTGTEVTGGGGDGRLEWLELRHSATGDDTHVAAAALFILIGTRPRTDWLPKA